MKNNQSERKKSALHFRINKQSFLGVLSLIFQELTDRFLTKFHFRLPKEEEVLRRVRKNAIANDPSSVLKIIDDFAYKKTFLMNIGDEKGLILEKAINDSNAKNILELGVYLGYSTIRILRNLDNFIREIMQFINKYEKNYTFLLPTFTKRFFFKAGKSDFFHKV